MKKAFLPLFLLIFFSFSALSQPLLIYGSVYYENQPIEGVNISVVDNRTGEKLYDITDANGSYSVVLIDLPSGWKEGDNITIIAKKDDLLGKNYTIAKNVGSIRVNLYLTPPPVADFYFIPKNPKVNEEIKFYDDSYHKTPIIFYQWNFDDGNISNDKNAVHAYKKEGNYSVSLKIIDKYGRDDIITKRVVVRGLSESKEEKINLSSYIIIIIIAIVIISTAIFWKNLKQRGNL